MSRDLVCLDCRRPAQWRWSKGTYVHVDELRFPFPTFDHLARVFPTRTPSESEQERRERIRWVDGAPPWAHDDDLFPDHSVYCGCGDRDRKGAV